ncbi:rhodoquinone biosynthesis methyltransferase RquA [Roseospira visakhapatnamensis]|uniref:SAM-dependent methyltransferase n=1 Tax=Roseospira visakhapatnamensis TaxID=390880 RepID=A0A7W6WA11_9PROT|nr:rhodoquinone biosynthesis methyltransferase RquA [Roseospira visakhapatnamensis]MBB4265986.1 SAM-dependent methyltransferase [Roseospira visakhapatnamensis]
MNKPHAVVPDVALESLDKDDPDLPASRPVSVQSVPEIPEYLRKVYTWAYLTPAYSRYLDTSLVVSAILWGNMNRLMRAGFSEFEPGQSVLQPACVYGSFSAHLAARLQPGGHLHVTDVAANQVEACRAKLTDYPNSLVGFADAAHPRDRDYDGVCCFFLLHEVPEDYKRRIVDSLLAATRPGGKTVFVDYHGPHWAHPLRPIMIVVWRLLEPYAIALSKNEIRSYASKDLADAFTWRKETYFGGLYQKVVAERRP